MQTTSPWESDFRSGLDYDSIRAERSTSAPPPDTSLFLGTNESMLGPYVSFMCYNYVKNL